MRKGRNGGIWLAFVIAACPLVIFIGAAAQSNAFPSKTMRIVVGFSAGGGNDLIARIIAQELLTSLWEKRDGGE